MTVAHVKYLCKVPTTVMKKKKAVFVKYPVKNMENKENIEMSQQKKHQYLYNCILPTAPFLIYLQSKSYFLLVSLLTVLFFSIVKILMKK